MSRMPLVAIDAGHGGTDPGALSATGLPEKDYALRQAMAASVAISAAGLQFVMTRTEDVFVGLRDRASVANVAGADAFISFHWNSSTSSVPSGTLTICHRESVRGISLAHLLLERIAPLDDAPDERWERVISVPDPMYRGGMVPTVIGRTRMPAVIVEVEFGTDPAADQLMNYGDGSYLARVADAAASACVDWWGNR